MARVVPLIDFSTIDMNGHALTMEDVRALNPQRYEMEHLSGIIHVDKVNHIIVGYKDVRDDEFWVRGHMPGYPLLPGVIICEACAQLSAFYGKLYVGNPDAVIGLGGLEDVRFRAAVRPGDRLILVCKGTRVDRRQLACETQAWVGDKLAFHGRIIGYPIPGGEEIWKVVRPAQAALDLKDRLAALAAQHSADASEPK